ncbi:hypothetical protein B0T20DRAFT_406701 [Sordaria brevicollis]|uniref:Uncharacterized protein n=1 Tax=Sordaria brevicollis TaxID=83679 RepID=A0AAE0PGY6_SORBR|nr:hypothetical protein B0T20DRAFT_406701 [Sordaria brevicollis]
MKRLRHGKHKIIRRRRGKPKPVMVPPRNVLRRLARKLPLLEVKLGAKFKASLGVLNQKQLSHGKHRTTRQRRRKLRPVRLLPRNALLRLARKSPLLGVKLEASLGVLNMMQLSHGKHRITRQRRKQRILEMVPPRNALRRLVRKLPLLNAKLRARLKASLRMLNLTQLSGSHVKHGTTRRRRLQPKILPQHLPQRQVGE